MINLRTLGTKKDKSAPITHYAVSRHNIWHTLHL